MISLSLALLIAGIALITDIRYHKVFNWLTLPAIGIGLILGFIPGQGGMPSHILGAGVGFGIFFILYAMKIVGGGDVKLMIGLGAIMGYPFIFALTFYSLVAGAVIGIFEMIISKRFLKGIKNIFLFFKQALTPELKPFIPEKDMGKIPFAVSIFIGVIISLLTGGNIPFIGGEV